MTLTDKIRAELQRTRKERRRTETLILSSLLGDIQNFQASKGMVADWHIMNIIQRLLDEIEKENQTLRRHIRETDDLKSQDAILRNTLSQICLSQFLPLKHTTTQILDFLRPYRDMLKKRGKGSFGVAMKLLNSNGFRVDAQLVKDALRILFY